MRLEIFDGKKGPTVRMVGDNGEKVFVTEAYASVTNAMRAARTILYSAAGCVIVRVKSDAPSRKAKGVTGKRAHTVVKDDA